MGTNTVLPRDPGDTFYIKQVSDPDNFPVKKIQKVNWEKILEKHEKQPIFKYYF